MADPQDDPREVTWHPRHAKQIVGHEAVFNRFEQALATGKPHHAWLLTGPKGIGKATLAYQLAARLLSETTPRQTVGWIAARSHPDLFVLERSLTDAKPPKLKSEISVEDARHLSAFFARTSGSGGWRVGLIDAVDDLNTESSNALLKLVEEPPDKAMLILVCHVPGRVLRTMRSRCLRMQLFPLSENSTRQVLENLAFAPSPGPEEWIRVARQSGGSPGRALELLGSGGAKAFDVFQRQPSASASERLTIAAHFATRQQALGDYVIFVDLLLDWLARSAEANATTKLGAKLAAAHSEISERRAVVEGYNLDRRVAVLDALARVQDALKAA